MFTHLKTLALGCRGNKTARCPRSAAFLPVYVCAIIFLAVAPSQAVEPGTPFAFEIKHDVSAVYWSPLIVQVTKTEGSEDMFGFDLLVDYDASVLRLNDVIPGEIFNDTGLYQWERFQWRVDSSTSPRQTIRIVAIADMNNGSHHPLITTVPDGTTLFNFSFTALPQAYTPMVVTPLRFRWQDCGDNMVVVNAGGDSVAVSLAVNEWTGSQFVDITDPNAVFPTDFGTPNACLDTAAGAPINRFVNYFDGAVTVFKPSILDNRGDINVNGIAYEVADFVMFYNYFFKGDSVFPNPGSSIPATDVNNDGVVLHLEDLVFLGRVACGDTIPVPSKSDGRQVVDSAIITQDVVSRTVSVDHPDTLAALFLVFQGEITPTFLLDTARYWCAAEYDGAFTRVMIVPSLFSGDCRNGFTSGPLFTYTGNGLLIEKESNLYPGVQIYDYPQAADFEDNYFNHNPIRIIGTDGRVEAAPDPLSAALARVSDAETIVLYMGDFDAHTAGDVDLATLRVNDSLVPLSTTILPSYAGFTGEVLTATVGARGFILSLDTLMTSGSKSFAVTGRYTDDQTFVIPGMLALVSENAAIGVPSGWPTIQAAINAAIDGDEVHVAGGTYAGDGNRDLEFNGKRILLTSTTGPEGTIIDCQGTSEANHRFINFHGNEDTLTVVDGFTIRGGWALGGGAIYVNSPAAPKILRCTFRENQSSGDGGAIGISLTSPIIEDCGFYANQAGTAGKGGAIQGQMAAPIIRNCEFRGNSAFTGGAVDLSDETGPSAPRPILQDCFFEGNQAFIGGGLSCSSSDPILERCVFDGNTASDGGGGLWAYDASPTLTFCEISRNTGGTEGGGLWLSGSAAALTNCTIAMNAADTGTGMLVKASSSPHIDKTIISANGSGGAFIIDGTSSVLFTCTDIAGNYDGEWVGAIEEQRWINGNLAIDPLFCIFPSGHDFSLYAISSCLPKNNSCHIQIGAYGWGCGTVCGDVNSDSVCTVGDAIFIVAYVFRGGPAPMNMIAADVNEDGDINLGDAIAIIGYIFRGQDILNCMIDK